MESSRFSPVPATCSEKEEQNINRNNEIKTYVRKINRADQWMEITNNQ